MNNLRLIKPAKRFFTHFLFWAFSLNFIVRLFFLYWNYAEFTDGYNMVDIHMLGKDQRLPFYPYLAHFLSFVISNREISAKIISMFMGSLSCVPVYFAAKELYDKRAGLFAVLLFSCSPLLFTWSIRIMPESSFILFMCCSYLYCIRYIKKTSFLNLSLAVFFSGLCLLSRPEGLLFIPILYLFYLLFSHKILRHISKNNKLIPKVIAAKIAVMFISVIPFLIFIVWVIFQGEFKYASLFKEHNSEFDQSRFLRFLWNYIKILPHIITWPVFFLWIYGYIADLKNRFCGHNKPIILLDLYLIVTVLFTMSFHGFWTTRHIMIIIPLLIIGSAGGISKCFKKFKNINLAYFILAISFVFSTALTAASLVGSREFFKDIKEASHYARDHLPGKRIYTMIGPSYKINYWSRKNVIDFYDRNHVYPGQFILLSDFYYYNLGIRENSSFIDTQEEIAYLESKFHLTILFRASSQVTPFLADYTSLDETVFGDLKSIYLPIQDSPLFREYDFQSVVLKIESYRNH